MSSPGCLRRSAASRRPNSNISSAAGLENGSSLCASSGSTAYSGSWLPSSRSPRSMISRRSSWGTPRISANTCIGISDDTSWTKSNSAHRQRAVQHLARDPAHLVLPHVHRPRREAARDQAAQLVVAGRVHVQHRLALLDEPRVDVLQRRPADLGREHLGRAVHGADVLVARDGPEPGAVGLGVPVHRVVAAQRRERLVRDGVHERVVVGQVDVLGGGRHAVSLQVVEVLLDLPVRDPAAVALDLEPLHGHERVHDLGAERGGQQLVGLERVQRLLERARAAGRRRSRPGRRRPRAAAAGSARAGGRRRRRPARPRSTGTGWRCRRPRAAPSACRRRARAGRGRTCCGCPSPSSRASAPASRARSGGRR